MLATLPAKPYSSGRKPSSSHSANQSADLSDLSLLNTSLGESDLESSFFLMSPVQGQKASRSGNSGSGSVGLMARRTILSAAAAPFRLDPNSPIHAKLAQNTPSPQGTESKFTFDQQKANPEINLAWEGDEQEEEEDSQTKVQGKLNFGNLSPVRLARQRSDADGLGSATVSRQASLDWDDEPAGANPLLDLVETVANPNNNSMVEPLASAEEKAASWDAQGIKFDVSLFDPHIPSYVMRTSEEKVVEQRWPQYLAPWQRFKKWQRLDASVFRHSQRQLVEHLNNVVGRLDTTGLWNVCQVPETIREATKIRPSNHEVTEVAVRTVRNKAQRISQEIAKWPNILHLPEQLMNMNNNVLNGYEAGQHPDIPAIYQVLDQAKALFFAQENSPPPRPAPPVLIYKSAVPAGREPNSHFKRRTIGARWSATHTANAYYLEYGRMARRVDWRKCNKGLPLGAGCLDYPIGLCPEEKLQEGTEYAVRLRALNDHGPSMWARSSVYAGRKDPPRSQVVSRAQSRMASPGNSQPGSRSASPGRGGQGHWTTPPSFSTGNGSHSVWAELKQSLELHLSGPRKEQAHEDAVAVLPPDLAGRIPHTAPFQAFVGGLDYNLTEQEVWTLFEDKCNIENVRLLRDEKNRSKGFCFIDLFDRASLIACLAEDGTSISGRQIKVNVADHPIASGQSSRRVSRPGSRVASRPNSRPGSRAGSPRRNTLLNSHSKNNSTNSSRRASRRSSPDSRKAHHNPNRSFTEDSKSSADVWRSPPRPTGSSAAYTPPRHKRGTSGQSGGHGSYGGHGGRGGHGDRSGFSGSSPGSIRKVGSSGTTWKVKGKQ